MAKTRGSDRASHTRAATKERPSRTRSGAVETARVLFSRGLFEVAIPRMAETRVKLEEFQLSGQAARIFTLGGSLSTNSKTLGPFDGKITSDDTGELIATLDDTRITVTRMTGQQGQTFLMYSLEFFLTSHGWRTAKVPEVAAPWHEGSPQQVLFRNGAGGTMHVWSMERLVLECSDNHKYTLYTSPEHKVLGWFDDWALYTHHIHGPFFRC